VIPAWTQHAWQVGVEGSSTTTHCTLSSMPCICNMLTYTRGPQGTWQVHVTDECTHAHGGMQQESWRRASREGHADAVTSSEDRTLSCTLDDHVGVTSVEEPLRVCGQGEAVDSPGR
jgi:hypothetical protein